MFIYLQKQRLSIIFLLIFLLINTFPLLFFHCWRNANNISILNKYLRKSSNKMRNGSTRNSFYLIPNRFVLLLYSLLHKTYLSSRKRNVSLTTYSIFNFTAQTGTPQMCQLTDGMRNPADIPSKNIKTSSTKRGKTPKNVRPGRSVWASKKNDKKPRIEITLGDKPVPTRSVKVIKARNVKKVQVVFVLPNNKKVRKVTIAIFIDFHPSDFTFTSKCHTFIRTNNFLTQFLRFPQHFLLSFFL